MSEDNLSAAEPEEVEEQREEEENEEEAPATADDAKDTPEVGPTPTPTGGRGRRERKSIEAFVPGDSEIKVKEAYPDGKGEKLSDIPNVVSNFKGITWSDPHLRILHTLAIGGQGKKKDLKSNLLEFSGIVYPVGKDIEAERQKVKDKMYKMKMPDLKCVMDLVDIDRSTASFGLDDNKAPDKEDHCNRLLKWLEKPVASGKRNAKEEGGGAPKKRKSGGMTAKKSPPPPSTKSNKTTEKKKTASVNNKSPPPKKAKKMDIDIPGVDFDKLREKVKSVVENSNKEEVTVKGVRKVLEDWLDTDLTEHKDAIRSLVMDAM